MKKITLTHNFKGRRTKIEKMFLFDELENWRDRKIYQTKTGETVKSLDEQMIKYRGDLNIGKQN